jgi:hypothetical protein
MGRHHAGDLRADGSYPNTTEKRGKGIAWFQVAQDMGDFVNTVRIVGFHKKRENSLQD